MKWGDPKQSIGVQADRRVRVVRSPRGRPWTENPWELRGDQHTVVIPSVRYVEGNTFRSKVKTPFLAALPCRSCRLSCMIRDSPTGQRTPVHPTVRAFLVLPSLRDDHAMEPAGLDFELLALKSIAGVDRVYEFLKVRLQQAQQQLHRVPCGADRWQLQDRASEVWC